MTGNRRVAVTFSELTVWRFQANSRSQHCACPFYHNDDGIRISQDVAGTKTHYLVDANNPTGYAQVLEEKQDDSLNGTIEDDEVVKSFTIGHDVIAQADTAAEAMFLMYDGHGSTRALLDKVADIVLDASQKQLFAFDAYGNLVIAPVLV